MFLLLIPLLTLYCHCLLRALEVLKGKKNLVESDGFFKDACFLYPKFAILTLEEISNKIKSIGKEIRVSKLEKKSKYEWVPCA